MLIWALVFYRALTIRMNQERWATLEEVRIRPWKHCRFVLVRRSGTARQNNHIPSLPHVECPDCEGGTSNQGAQSRVLGFGVCLTHCGQKIPNGDRIGQVGTENWRGGSFSLLGAHTIHSNRRPLKYGFTKSKLSDHWGQMTGLSSPLSVADI